ncbi:MAG: hypothetical protein PWP47_1400 [Synergistaceae bacterium]|nr:hypothetical protein [Synergistaceae bacterium]
MNPGKMELPAREHVVDEAAQRFADFLNGVVGFVEKGKPRLFSGASVAVVLSAEEEHFHEDGMSSFRYRSEAGLNLRRERLSLSMPDCRVPTGPREAEKSKSGPF